MVKSGELVPDADTQGLAMAMLTAIQGGLLLARTLHDARPLKFAMDMAIGHVERFAAP